MSPFFSWTATTLSASIHTWAGVKGSLLKLARVARQPVLVTVMRGA